MALDRNGIHDAILARVTAAYAWARAPSRNVLDLEQVTPADQPTAVVLASTTETADQAAPGRTLRWRLSPRILVYARADDPSVPASQVLFAILTSLETGLQWQKTDPGPVSPGAPGTLGGKVLSCRIASIEIAEDAQCVALITLEVIASA